MESDLYKEPHSKHKLTPPSIIFRILFIQEGVELPNPKRISTHESITEAVAQKCEKGVLRSFEKFTCARASF